MTVIRSTLMRLKKIALMISVTIGLLFTAACDVNETAQVVIKNDIIRPALIEVVASSTDAKLRFNGVVRSAQRADLAFRMNGRIIDVLVDEGVQVKKGQLLAQLDPRDAKTALESARLEYKNTKVEFTRGETIYKKTQAISKSELDVLQTRNSLAKNSLEEATRQLEYTQLNAPFDGIVGRKLVDNHVQIQANQTILTVHNIDQLEVLINIPDSVMLGELRGTKAFAEISAINGETFPLVLSTYGTQADPITQTYPVVLTFEDLQGFNVLPGMAVKVVPEYSINPLQTASIITIPLTAVVPNNQGGQFIWLLDEQNKVLKRVIKTGSLFSNRIVISEGLAIGDRVIIAGVSSLKENMIVQPYSDKPATGNEG